MVLFLRSNSRLPPPSPPPTTTSSSSSSSTQNIAKSPETIASPSGQTLYDQEVEKAPTKCGGVIERKKERMFKRSKSQVLVDDTPEEDEEVQWHCRHTDVDKEEDGEDEEIASPASKELKVKIIRSKKDKKLFSSEDDEHFLLTGVTPSEARGSAKKSKEEDKRTYLEKGQCFWDSVTMTMKQVTPTKKMCKSEGRDPASIGGMTEEPVAGDTLIRQDEALPWTDLEGDLSKYASLSGPRGPGPRWTTKAKDKLASIRRRSLSENWEGLK